MEPVPLIFDKKSRVAVLAPTGQGKTGVLLELIQHSELFPPDVKQVYWLNFTGIEKSAPGFEIFDENPEYYHLMDSDAGLAMLESPPPDFHHAIVVLDDCFAGSVDTATSAVLETVLKKNTNHLDLVLFMTVQSAFSKNFESHLREQANVFMFVNDVGEVAKFEAFVKRILKTHDSETGNVEARVIRHLTDTRGGLDVTQDSKTPFSIIVKNSSGYKFEFWGWSPDFPAGFYYINDPSSNYRIAPHYGSAGP